MSLKVFWKFEEDILQFRLEFTHFPLSLAHSDVPRPPPSDSDVATVRLRRLRRRIERILSIVQASTSPASPALTALEQALLEMQDFPDADLEKVRASLYSLFICLERRCANLNLHLGSLCDIERFLANSFSILKGYCRAGTRGVSGPA